MGLFLAFFFRPAVEKTKGEVYYEYKGEAEKLLEEIGRHTVPVRQDRQNKRDLKAKGFAGFTYRVSS